MAQPGGTLVRPDHPTRHSPGHLHQRADLIQKIDSFVRHYNCSSRPFVWTATADPSSTRSPDFVRVFPGHDTSTTVNKANTLSKRLRGSASFNVKLLVISAHPVAPGAQQKRFAADLDRLAQAAGHLDRVVPLKSYRTGLLLPGERKSESRRPRLCPDNVRQTHQSLHHAVADAPRSDEDILESARQTRARHAEQGPIEAWIVDDTGLVKKGPHPEQVPRQYCGQVGKQENCRVAASSSISTAEVSLPIAWRSTYRQCGPDNKRRTVTEYPGSQVSNQAKIALQQIRTALDREIPAAPVLSDAAYGNEQNFARASPDWGCCTRWASSRR